MPGKLGAYFVPNALGISHIDFFMDAQGFPYEPTLLAFALGALAGLWRGMQARAKALLPTAQERLARVRQRKRL